MWPGPRPTSMPSFLLIRSTTWPQQAYTNVTEKTGQTDVQDNGLIAWGKPIYKRFAQKSFKRADY